MSHKNKENEQWKLLVSNLKEKAREKFGNGWQTELAEKTGFNQSNISRMNWQKQLVLIKVISAECLV